MITKKMLESHSRDGYTTVEARPQQNKGKGRAQYPANVSESNHAPSTQHNMRSPPRARSQTSDYRFPEPSPPPCYNEEAAVETRPVVHAQPARPNSMHRASAGGSANTVTRPNVTRSVTGTLVSTVRTKPPGPAHKGPSDGRGSGSAQGEFGPPLASPASTRTMRSQRSRDFVASRRNSSAAVAVRRRSRATSPSISSRKSSVVFLEHRLRQEGGDAELSLLYGRRGSAASVPAARQLVDPGWSNSTSAAAAHLPTECSPMQTAAVSSYKERATDTTAPAVSPVLEHAESSSSTYLSEESDPSLRSPDLWNDSSSRPLLEGLEFRGLAFRDPALAEAPEARRTRQLVTDGSNTHSRRADPASRSTTDHTATIKVTSAASERPNSPYRPDFDSSQEASVQAIPPAHESSASAIGNLLRRSPTLQSAFSRRFEQGSAASAVFPSRPSSATSSRPHSRASSVLPRSSSDGLQRASSNRLIARKPTVLASSDDIVNDIDDDDDPANTREVVDLMDMIRDGPTARSGTRDGVRNGSGAANENGQMVDTEVPSSIKRVNKRWTMSGILRSPAPDPESAQAAAAFLNAPSSSSSRLSPQNPRRRAESGPERPRPMAATQMATGSSLMPSPSFVTTNGSRPEYKRRRSSAYTAHEPPQLPASARAPPDPHPANVS